MTAFAHSHTAVEIRVLREHAAPREAAHDRLRLLPAGDGWSLVGADGAVLFHALGVSGRRRCLEFAREHGVLAVFS